MSKTLNKPAYGNCKVLDASGKVMFLCDDDRMNWYLARNLAKVVSPLTIQLLFTPKGPGHVGDDFYLQEKHNRCVVCGAIDDLTKHHVVPKGYRKFFPNALKSHSSHDVLVLCIDCHETYEQHAHTLKIKIGEEFGIPIDGKGIDFDKKLWRVSKAAYALKNYREKMSAERVEKLLTPLREYFGSEQITKENIDVAVNLVCVSVADYIHHGKYVVDHLADIEAFVKRWRRHFIATMQPQYLPDGWDVERSIWRNANASCDRNKTNILGLSVAVERQDN